MRSIGRTLALALAIVSVTFAGSVAAPRLAVDEVLSDEDHNVWERCRSVRGRQP